MHPTSPIFSSSQILLSIIMASNDKLSPEICVEATTNHSMHDATVNFIHDQFWHRFYTNVQQDLRYPAPIPPTWMELNDLYYCGVVANEMVIALRHRCMF